MVLIIGREEIERILTMEETIEEVEKAFKNLSLGKVIMPIRSNIPLKKYSGIIYYMPAYIEEMEALAIKVVSVHSENYKYGLPTTQATILLNEAKTGKLLSIMDGGYITAMRTGAASGVATKYMARKNAKVAGIFGAGVQARTQLIAVCKVRPIERAYVYDVRMDAAEKYAVEMSKMLGIDVKVMKEPKKLVDESEIICAATTSKTPIFNGEWLREGTHINGIGAHTPDARELDTTTIKRSKVVVDSYEACLKEAGEIIIPLNEKEITRDHIYAELGEIIAGRKVGRINDKEITLFKSVGLAIQDAATALKVYQKALENRVGKEIKI
ncbi:MAG: hypothetical protein QXI93_03355 [Candidatus Methanomethylicia archaeon]